MCNKVVYEMEILYHFSSARVNPCQCCHQPVHHTDNKQKKYTYSTQLRTYTHAGCQYTHNWWGHTHRKNSGAQCPHADLTKGMVCISMSKLEPQNKLVPTISGDVSLLNNIANYNVTVMLWGGIFCKILYARIQSHSQFVVTLYTIGGHTMPQLGNSHCIQMQLHKTN